MIDVSPSPTVKLIGGFTLDFKYIVSALESQVNSRPTLEINRSHAKIACHLKNNLSIIFRAINFLLVHAKFFVVCAVGMKNYAVLSKKEMSFSRTVFPLSSLFERKNIRHSTNKYALHIFGIITFITDESPASHDVPQNAQCCKPYRLNNRRVWVWPRPQHWFQLLLTRRDMDPLWKLHFRATSPTFEAICDLLRADLQRKHTHAGASECGEKGGRIALEICNRE